MIRSLILMSCLLCVTACGKSQSEMDAAATAAADAATLAQKNKDDAAIAASQKQEQEAADTREQKITEAISFINSKLDDVSSSKFNGSIESGYALSVNIQSLSTDQWTWTESEAAVSQNGATDITASVSNKLQYSVKPSDLSSTTRVSSTANGLFSVKIDCRAERCIHAFGRTLHDVNGSQQFEDVDDMRSTNLWMFKTQDDAKRVSQAMANLLAMQGASEGY
jgi:hypothetical protein